MLKNQPVSQAADLIYSNIEMLAIGIQMAGPKLTPESFEKGMFSYPQRTGSQGTWKFGPGDYTTSQDAREVYWDPRVISPVEGARFMDRRHGQAVPHRSVPRR